MDDKKQKPRKKSHKVDFLKPIDLNLLGSKDDVCFGKHYDLSTEECKVCGDSELCSIAFGQNLHLRRKHIEENSRFKDIELANSDDKIDFIKSKLSKNILTIKIAKLVSKKYGIDLAEAKKLVKTIKNG